MSFRRKPKRAAILGCGPAGLFAAHAFAQNGWEFDIFSRKRRSEMFGAQYLHKPIWGLDNGNCSATIRYTLTGTIEQYRQKVYGDRSVAYVSPEKLVGEHQVWDVRRAYYSAWDRYSDHIVDMPNIDAEWLRWTAPDFGVKLSDYRYIISTIPADRLCMHGHYFGTQNVWAIGDAPERGVFCPVIVANNTVVCNGEASPGWYRASNMFGYRSAEWPGGSKPPISDIAGISKPIGNNCTCWTDLPHFLRFGRYGSWEKSALSHDGYYAITEMLS